MTTHSPSDLPPPAGNAASPACPVGESHCEIIGELLELRQTVSELQQQMRTDPLTGLFNFRHFRDSLQQEMQRSQRTEQPTALLMLDLDYFKQVNDSWGHEAGNQALVATASIIKNTVRQLDIACRYGGEEFAIILPATNLLIAVQVAERIRRQIESSQVMIDTQPLALTASLGVDIYTAGTPISAEQLVERADHYLYQAKQQGRNRVCHGTVLAEQNDSAVSKEERQALSDFFGDDNDTDIESPGQ